MMSKGIFITMLAFLAPLALAEILPGDPRHADPVILDGTKVPELLGKDPNTVVGFRFLESAAAWEQVPVQIDEMHYQDWLIIKQGDCRLLGRDMYGHVWADEGTYSGPDQDPTFDEDDEFVFMARHLGDQKQNGFPNPPGTNSDFEVVLEIQDPVQGHTTVGYLYVFISDGSINPDANNRLIDYSLNLVNTNAEGSNNYFDAYQFECTDGSSGSDTGYECHDNVPVNPEDTWFRSEFYERHFAENWHTDELRIKAGDSTGENFINTQEFQIVPFECGRCVESFVRGRTAFVANKAGPVRAIRSYVGANSGTITQRETHMYEQREDHITYLRVHTMPGLMDYMVYKAGTPLTYYNEFNMDGFSIDGVNSPEEEAFNATWSMFEMVTGATGTFLRALELHHDVTDWMHKPDMDPEPFVEMWYYDNETPDCLNCGSEGAAVHPNNFHLCSSVYNGKPEAWGTHGLKSRPPWMLMLNTDPARHILYDSLPEDACDVEVIEPWLFHFNITFHQYYLEPNTDPMVMEQYYLNSVNDLERRR